MSNNLNSYSEFTSLRKKRRYLKIRGYKYYTAKVRIRSVTYNPHYFWTFYVTQKLIDKLPCTMTYRNPEADTGGSIVDLFKI